MHSLNPLLRAFFKSSLSSQCNRSNDHVRSQPLRCRRLSRAHYDQILLVPTTEVLLTSKDLETNILYADFVSSEEFVASHVLRVTSAATTANFRDGKGKAKQYATINGRSVVVKESFVYGNKGTNGPL